MLPAAVLKRKDLLLAIGVNCDCPKFMVHTHWPLLYTVMESEQAITGEQSRPPGSDSEWGQEKASRGSPKSVP